MLTPLDIFEKNIARAEHLVGLYKAGSAMFTPAIDMSDILRASIVAAVSALDAFVHSRVISDLHKIADGNLPIPKGIKAQSISLRSAIGIKMGNAPWQMVMEEVTDSLSWQTFQTPDKIADAFRLVTDKIIWEEVSKHTSINSKELKIKLKLIVDRRNKIAHEGDMQPGLLGEVWPIEESQVIDVIDFIKKIVSAMCKV